MLGPILGLITFFAMLQWGFWIGLVVAGIAFSVCLAFSDLWLWLTRR